MRLRSGITPGQDRVDVESGAPADRARQPGPQTADDRPAPPHRRVLIGGVGYRWMGDASFGLLVSDELARQDWPPGIDVADLGYGALFVTQDLQHAEPPYDRLILVSGMERGRTPGTIAVERCTPAVLEPEDVQARIFEAGAGVIDVDHLLAIAQYFDALPAEVVTIEVEPVHSSGEALSPDIADLMPEVAEQARRLALAASI